MATLLESKRAHEEALRVNQDTIAARLSQIDEDRRLERVAMETAAAEQAAISSAHAASSADTIAKQSALLKVQADILTAQKESTERAAEVEAVARDAAARKVAEDIVTTAAAHAVELQRLADQEVADAAIVAADKAREEQEAKSEKRKHHSGHLDSRGNAFRRYDRDGDDG